MTTELSKKRHELISKLFNTACNEHVKKYGSMKGVFHGDIKNVIKRGFR